MADFKDLRVYHLALENLKDTFEFTKGLPIAHPLKNQMERAATSVVSNICEGSSRNSDKEYRQFLAIARGSNSELTGQWQIAIATRLIPQSSTNIVLDRLDHAGRSLTKLIKALDGS